MTAATPPLASSVEPTPPPAPRGLLALLLGVVAAPRATFAYLRDQGGWSWLWPLLAALALAVAARAVALPIQRAEAEAALAELQAQLSGEGSPAGDGFVVGNPTGGIGVAPQAAGPGAAASSPLLDYGLPALAVAWDWALRGGVLLGLAWVLGGRANLGAMFRLSGWSLVPDIARFSVAIVVMLTVGRVPARGLTGLEQASGEPTVSMPVESENSAEGAPSVMSYGPGMTGVGGPNFLSLLRSTLLGALDVYTLWTLALLVIGTAVMARLGWIKASLATLVYWGLSLSLAALPPLFSLWLLRLSGPGLR